MRYLIKRFFLVFCIFLFSIHSYSIESRYPESIAIQQNSLSISTIHGSLCITDPLIIELINSQAMQRLKNIRQYGSTDYALKHRVGYSRFEHSLGVFYLLHKHGASRVEQVAGLLHDVSHTVFSHSCDPLFMGDLTKDAYQDMIHEQFLCEHGIKEILAAYGLTALQVMPKNKEFRALEQDAPALCADRIEYNIYAAYMDNLLTTEEIASIHKDLHFNGHDWYFDTIESARNFASISLHQTVYMWGSPVTILCNNWTSEIFKRSLETGLLSKEDICYNITDDIMWKKLQTFDDPYISSLVPKIISCMSLFSWPLDEHAITVNIKAKFRGVNPWVKTEKGLMLLTELDPAFKNEYATIKQHMQQGWNIILHTQPTRNGGTIGDPRKSYSLVSKLQQRNSAYC